MCFLQFFIGLSHIIDQPVAAFYDPFFPCAAQLLDLPYLNALVPAYGKHGIKIIQRAGAVRQIDAGAAVIHINIFDILAYL